MARRRFQFGLSSLFGFVTFAALMFWLASLGTLSCILAIAIVKHVLVAWLCMWYMDGRPKGNKTSICGQSAADLFFETSRECKPALDDSLAKRRSAP